METKSCATAQAFMLCSWWNKYVILFWYKLNYHFWWLYSCVFILVIINLCQNVSKGGGVICLQVYISCWILGAFGDPDGCVLKWCCKVKAVNENLIKPLATCLYFSKLDLAHISLIYCCVLPRVHLLMMPVMLCLPTYRGELVMINALKLGLFLWIWR